MLDDLNDIFYDVDYGYPALGNQVAWIDLALHTVPRPAIVFPPEQQDMLQNAKCAAGLLVSVVISTEEPLCTTRYLGHVFVQPLPRAFMNWSALKDVKGPELPAEMRAGLLRRVWPHDSSRDDEVTGGFVTPASVLNKMPRKWHMDGVALNYELDKRFVGAKTFGSPSRWSVSGLGSDQIQESRAREAVFIEQNKST